MSAFDRARLDDKAVESLKRDIKNAKTLVYFADNCGEIVADKLLISTLRKINPNLDVSVIVRGKPVLNDVTVDDARQVGLYDVAVIEEGAVVGENPEKCDNLENWGVSVVGAGVTVGKNAIVKAQSMISEDVKEGEKV